jgi:hypothetical protein
MAEDEATSGGIALAEREDVAAEEEAQPKRGLFGLGRRKEEDEEPEHEIELMTPFGKLELEFEPTSQKQRREQKRHAKEQAEAAKDAAKQQAKALKQQADALKKQAKKGVTTVHEKAAPRAKKGGGKGKLALILLGIAVVGGAIALAYWLFARTPEELDTIPTEYRADDYEPEREPAGLVAKARHRVRHAVRAGQRASRDAQLDQQQRYEEMTRGG